MYLYNDMGFVIFKEQFQKSIDSDEIKLRPPFTGIKSYICSVLNQTKSTDAEDFIHENR